jgi:hypothetical protein
MREIVASGHNDSTSGKIKAFVAIEASQIVEKDDASDIRNILGKITVNMESSSAPKGYRLAYRKEMLGCITMSLVSFFLHSVH